MGLLNEISGKDHISDAKKHLLLHFEKDIDSRAISSYYKMISRIKDDASNLRFKNKNGKKTIEGYVGFNCYSYNSSSVNEHYLKLAGEHKEFFVSDPDFEHFLNIFPHHSKDIYLHFSDEDFSYSLRAVEKKRLGCFKTKIVPTRWATMLMQRFSELCKDDGIHLTFGVKKIDSDKIYQFEKPYAFIKGGRHLVFGVKYSISYD